MPNACKKLLLIYLILSEYISMSINLHATDVYANDYPNRNPYLEVALFDSWI